MREPRPIRVAAAAALPILASTVLFTFSRGAIGAGAVGLVVYALLGRPRGLLSGLLAAGPPTAVAVIAAYGAERLASAKPTAPAAVAQGHKLAVVVLACVLAAAALRLILSLLDDRLRQLRLPPERRRRVLALGWAAAAIALAAFGVAANVAGWASSNWERFVHNPSLARHADLRGRLTDPSNSQRLDLWNVALDGYRTAALRGEGAGTYPLLWRLERPGGAASGTVKDAHSLYVEVLGELGVVGLLLLLAALAPLLWGFLALRRAASRSLYAAAVGAAVAWALHAGVDWDWEMPAVTVWLFAFGGAALAAESPGRKGAVPSRGARLIVSVAVVLAAVAPALVLLSQRRLEQSADAFERGDCGLAIRRSAQSIEILENRPEPYEALAYCQVRRGNARLAAQAMSKAVERDPENWQFRYGLALVQGAAGLDPRPEARQAELMNPRDPITSDLIRWLRRGPLERKRITTSLAAYQGLSQVR